MFGIAFLIDGTRQKQLVLCYHIQKKEIVEELVSTYHHTFNKIARHHLDDQIIEIELLENRIYQQNKAHAKKHY